jgi:hypothetical protein
MIYFVAFFIPSMQMQACCFTSLSFTVYRHLLPNVMIGNFLVLYSMGKECGKFVTRKFWLVNNFSLQGI